MSSKFNQTKLEQLQKKLGTLAVHACSSHSSIALKGDKCFEFFCNKPARSENFHNAST